MKIVYDDDDIIIVDKPFGVPSVPDDTKRCSLLEMIEKEKGYSLFPVHRLDAETGGIILFAKNKNSASVLSDEIRNSQFRKLYRAVVSDPVPDEEVLEDHIVHDEKHNISRIASPDKKGSKYAKLSFVKLASHPPFSLLEIKLETGRTHQIRVQFASRGYPICGDSKYSGIRAQKLCLFASKLSFRHPSSGEMLEFSLPLPDFIPFSCFLCHLS